jgi:hypothetical protein
VPRDRLLADVQFQGAISDFHCIKDALKAADYDPLLLRANEDDAYSDGGNYEVATTRAAAEAWLEADAAAAAEAAAAAQAAAAAEAAGGGVSGPPRSKQRRDPRPWQDLGSEVGALRAGPLGRLHTHSDEGTPALEQHAGAEARGHVVRCRPSLRQLASCPPAENPCSSSHATRAHRPRRRPCLRQRACC